MRIKEGRGGNSRRGNLGRLIGIDGEINLKWAHKVVASPPDR